MSREEEIKKIAHFHANKFRDTNLEEEFVAMARWADNNPASPWISIKDRLPDFGEHVFALENGEDAIKSWRFEVIVEGEKGERHVEWRWAKALENVTHWMPIPELPKKS